MSDNPYHAQGPATDDTDRRLFTDDGVRIMPGLRVLTNNWRWGTVTDRERGGSDPACAWFDGWWDVQEDGGSSGLFNGERMTTRPPAGAPADPTPNDIDTCPACKVRVPDYDPDGCEPDRGPRYHLSHAPQVTR